MSRTALIVKVPAIKKLVALRQRFASDATYGVPPHITVLFPFIPAARLSKQNLSVLRQAVGGIPKFDFSLTRTRWFGDHILWLAPANPSPFIGLTDAVVGAFPDYPPYGGAHDGSAPHATVGDSGDHVALLRAERELSPLLPISGVVAAVTLIVEDADGQWSEHIDIPLAKRG